MQRGPLSSRSIVIRALREEEEGQLRKKEKQNQQKREKHFILGGKERQERPNIVGHSSALGCSASPSRSAVCHVDIAKLNSFYWARFLA